MGRAMLDRWIACSENAHRFTVIKPTPLPHDYPAQHYASVSDAPKNANIVILAVKPQMMQDVLPDIVAHYGADPLYVTIAAGMASRNYGLAKGAALVRVMPNMPVAIGQGSVILYSAKATEVQREAVDALCAPLGTLCWLEDEALMDAATAIAGSGPAYIYYFMECLIAAGCAHGLSAAQAQSLVASMTQGAANSAFHHAHRINALREAVTSKGGTTAAALQVFMQPEAMSKITHDAIDAAVSRAKAMA